MNGGTPFIASDSVPVVDEAGSHWHCKNGIGWLAGLAEMERGRSRLNPGFESTIASFGIKKTAATKTSVFKPC